MLHIVVLFVCVAGMLAQDVEEICFNDPPYPVGCFDTRPPFEDFPLPESPADMNITFRLFTNQTAEEDDFELITPTSWGAFDPNRPTKFFVHGFRGSGDSTYVWILKDAILEMLDCNMIAVEWGGGQGGELGVLGYPQAASNARAAGAMAAHLMNSYANNPQLGLNLETVHCIGTSLGGQFCGFMAKNMNKLGRATGLDPAGPWFDVEDPRGRLAAGDAIFTDVIHSNGRDDTTINLGVGRPSGDADFYPNGGRLQPGCEDMGILSFGCSHALATAYFVSSLLFNDDQECRFWANPCPNFEDMDAGVCSSCDANTNCQMMGWNSDQYKNRTGLFYLTTDGEGLPPWCLNRARGHTVQLSSHRGKAFTEFITLAFDLLEKSML